MSPRRIAVLGAAMTTIPVASALGASASPHPVHVARVLPAGLNVQRPVSHQMQNQAERQAKRRARWAHLMVRHAKLAREARRLGLKVPALRHDATFSAISRANGRLYQRVARAQKAAQAQQPAGGTTYSGSAPSGQLQAIAACESGGNPQAIGGGGAFRGKYQFTYSTWASVGGSGDPAAAPEAEQDARAAELLARSGTSPWPVCGQ
jgi:hypothetical protein